MSHDLNLFFAGRLGFPDFCRRVQDLLGLEFTRFEDGEAVFFHYLDSAQDIMLNQYELEDNLGIRFTRFPFQVSVQSTNIQNASKRLAADQHLARSIFRILTEAGLGPAILVEDLQQVVPIGH